MSGLRIVVPSFPDGSPGGEAGPPRAFFGGGEAFDFILADVGEIGDGSWEDALAADADLIVFALSPEDVPEASARLGQKLSAAAAKRTATLVIATGRDGSDPNAPKSTTG